MIFSSNRPGGFGAKDLYIVKKLPNGEWALPMNMGPGINTKLDEDSPFLHSDGKTLYYSSKGYNSMGGYDIFVSERTFEGTWTYPKNLGFPVNTVGDDIYFVLSSDGKIAYYSTEKGKEGQGDHDIYRIEMLASEAYLIIAMGKIVDIVNDLPIKAKITVVDSKNRVNGIYSSNEVNGRFILTLNPGVKYKIVIEAENYHSQVLHREFEKNKSFYEFKDHIKMIPLE